MSEVRSPDFNLRVRTSTGKTATVGSGWLSAAGHINLKLNPGVHLRWDDELQITIFVRSESAGSKQLERDLVQIAKDRGIP